MVTIQTGGVGDNLKLVCTFEHDKYPRGGQNVGVDSMKEAAKNAGLEYDDIYDKDYPEYGTTIGVVELKKRSIMAQRIEDFKMVARVISGYFNVWLVSDEPEEHPEIYKQIQTFERL